MGIEGFLCGMKMLYYVVEVALHDAFMQGFSKRPKKPCKQGDVCRFACFSLHSACFVGYILRSLYRSVAKQILYKRLTNGFFALCGWGCSVERQASSVPCLFTK